jgi:TolB-like protein
VQWTRLEVSVPLTEFARRVRELLAGVASPAVVRPGGGGRRGATGEGKTSPVPDYELVRKIGEGGYGEVWLARGVTGVWRAVKIVWRARFADTEPFEREFRGVKESMQLPVAETGTLMLHHVGRNDAAGCFHYVMELADDASGGPDVNPARYVPLTLKELRTRRGRLPAAECVALGRQIAGGLAALHARGLVHRDIKPSNIVFVNGAPKLADIGLMSAATRAQTFVGTEGYVPPEGPGTAGADVFALGRVLYELATGRDRQEFPQLPEQFSNAAERAVYFRLNEVLLQAGEADPAKRYRDAGEMAADLGRVDAGQAVARRPGAGGGRWRRTTLAVAVLVLAGVGSMALWRKAPERVTGTQKNLEATTATTATAVAPVPAPVEKSLLVLPWETIGGDAALAALAEGVHADVIAALTRIAELKVQSRAAALAFKGSALPLTEIGRRAGVVLALSGTFRRAGDGLRVQAQVRRTSDEAVVWQDTVEIAAPDGTKVQERIAAAAGSYLRARFARGAWAGAEFTTANAEAMRRFARARVLHGMQRPTAATFEEQIQLCEQALELDPSFMYAANVLSISYAYASQGMRSDRDKWLRYRTEAKRWAEAASRMMPGGAGDGALAVYYKLVERDPMRALAYAENEVRALPNDGNGYNRLAISYNEFGQADRAVEMFERGVSIDPHNFRMLHSFTVVLANLRRYPEFLAMEARTLSVHSENFPRENYAEYHFRLTGKHLPLTERSTAPRRRIVAVHEGRMEDALKILDGDLEAATNPIARIRALMFRALVLDSMGRTSPEEMRAAEAMEIVEKLKPAPEEDQAEHDFRRMWVAWMAGRPDEALVASRRFLERVTPPNLLRDVWDREEIVAELYARMGRTEECLTLLEKLIRVPSGITVPRLLNEPAWRRVRDHPRFKALVADPRNSGPL